MVIGYFRQTTPLRGANLAIKEMIAMAHYIRHGCYHTSGPGTAYPRMHVDCVIVPRDLAGTCLLSAMSSKIICSTQPARYGPCDDVHEYVPYYEAPNVLDECRRFSFYQYDDL